jgi:hypothetical protein
MVYFYLKNTGIRTVLYSQTKSFHWVPGKRHAWHAATPQRCARRLASPLTGVVKRCRPAASTCPPGLIAGVCTVFAGSDAATVASNYHLTGLRARVDGLRRPQIHGIDPLSVHFSLHDLGEYEVCQAEFRALLAFDPVIARPSAKGATGADGVQVVSDHMFIRTVETRPVKVLDDRLEH